MHGNCVCVLQSCSLDGSDLRNHLTNKGGSVRFELLELFQEYSYLHRVTPTFIVDYSQLNKLFPLFSVM